MTVLKFTRITGHDISSIFRNRFIRVSVIAILIVPMLYSLCYLAAFWNPYGRLDQLPVAVLNLDEGADLDGKSVNYGKDVITDLKENHEVAWSFVSQDDLKDGLASTKYYSLFTIPSDFSQKIVSAKTSKPAVAEIVYTSNQAKNFLASQISGNVETQLKEQVSASVTKEYAQGAFDGLYDAKDGLQQASDGAAQLYDGVSELNGKIPTLASGVIKLTDGSSTLQNGLLQLNANAPALKSGSTQLENGLDSLNSQVPALQNGASQLADGADALKSGIDDLHTNSQALAAGIGAAYDGSKTLHDGISQLNGSMPALTEGSAALKTGTAALKASTDTLLQGSGEAVSGLDDIMAATSSTTQFETTVGQIDALIDAGDTANAKALLDGLKTSYIDGQGQLTDNLRDVRDGVSQIQTGLGGIQYALDPANETMPDGSPAFAAGVSRLDAGINAAADGTAQLADGSADLYAGLSELDGKLPALSDGIDQLAGGAEQLDTGANALSEKTPALADGVSQLAAGGSKLADGVGQAADGITQLADGSSSLHEGLASLSDQVPALADGVGQLTDGTSELKTKLADGVDYIDGNLVNSSETMAAYISDPVTMSNQPLNPVPDYGTGFAPYFIPLSLWVGAILMFFIISPREDPSLKANSAQSAIGKYLSYAFIGLLQAVMVGAVVFTLGLQPNNIPLYFLTIIVMSLTAIAIVQMLISLLGDAGRLIAIVLLILQLTADAGTFPLELVPNFFKVLNPFMPFTYCVTALRESISGTNITLIWQCIGMLLIFLGVFLTLTVIFKKRAEKMQEHVNQLRFTE